MIRSECWGFVKMTARNGREEKRREEKREVKIPIIIPTVTKVRRPKTILMEGAMDFKTNCLSV